MDDERFEHDIGEAEPRDDREATVRAAILDALDQRANRRTTAKPTPVKTTLDDDKGERGTARCILCDWTLGSATGLSLTFSKDTIFPQRYDDAWLAKKGRDYGVCSVCREEIRKAVKEETKPKWFATYLTKSEKASVASWRKRAQRGQCTKQEADSNIHLIQERSDERFYYLYQDKFDGPPKFKISEEWLEFCDEHRKKTRHGIGSDTDLTLELPDYSVMEAQSELRLDQIFASDNFDDYIDPDGADNGADYNHGYSHGYGWHRLDKPPREDYNDKELYGKGLRGASKAAKQAWAKYKATWNKALKQERQRKKTDADTAS